MNLFKKVKSFEFILVSIFFMFFIYQMISFSQMDAHYMGTSDISLVRYVIGCLIVIAYMVIVLYVCPLLLIIKWITYRIQFKPVSQTKRYFRHANAYINLANKIQVYKRYQVIRC